MPTSQSSYNATLPYHNGLTLFITASTCASYPNAGGKVPVFQAGDEPPPLHVWGRWDDQSGVGTSWSCATALPHRRISTSCQRKKNILVVPFQLKNVWVAWRRARRKNIPVLHHRHTSFFSRVEFVRSRALAGCESINARKRNGSRSEARMSSTPECVCRKVRDTRHEALSQERESVGPTRNPLDLFRGGLSRHMQCARYRGLGQLNTRRPKAPVPFGPGRGKRAGTRYHQKGFQPGHTLTW